MTRKLRTASNVGPLGCWDNFFFQHIGFQQVSFAGLVPVNAVLFFFKEKGYQRECKIQFCFNFASCLPVGDVPGPIATLGQVIENQTSGATVAARFLTTDANVKVLAISWVSVQWVDELGSCWLSLKNSGRAIKCNDVCNIKCKRCRYEKSWTVTSRTSVRVNLYLCFGNRHG